MTAAPTRTVDIVAYDHPRATALVEELMADLSQRYGGSGDGTPIDPRQFDAPDGAFLVLVDDGRDVGCVALRLLDATDVPGGIDGDVMAGHTRVAELKRMFTRPEVRRTGAGRALLAALEERARELGFTRVVLETGTAQPEAIALYTSSGYTPIPGFGHYRDAPLSRCYSRDL